MKDDMLTTFPVSSFNDCQIETQVVLGGLWDHKDGEENLKWHLSTNPNIFERGLYIIFLFLIHFSKLNPSGEYIASFLSIL